MSLEEARNQFQRLFSEMEAWKKKKKAFLQETEEILFSFPLEYWNHDPSEREKLKVPLQKLAESYGLITFDCFGSAQWYTYNNTRPKKIVKVRNTLKTKEEGEKQLQEELKDIPEDKDYYCTIFWEDFEHNQKIELFHYTLHNKLKEILTDHFEEEILDFEGYILRNLDGSVYHRVVYPFIDNYFELVFSTLGY